MKMVYKFNRLNRSPARIVWVDSIEEQCDKNLFEKENKNPQNKSLQMKLCERVWHIRGQQKN